ncbi:uncharacterized protein LOC116172245 isoform X1 [Photinus pyralis]|nr:uncharacterized protein LOC116172245 isoform X1 [Photinus pyralis]
MLVQQRSQDSDMHPPSDVRSCHWRLESGIGSDSNLSKKRDIGFMRKSTLLRRLWGSYKPLSERTSRFSSSFYDWHYGKSNASLNSNTSSPEHVKCKCKCGSEEFKTPPVPQKVVNTKLQPQASEQKIPPEESAKLKSHFSSSRSRKTCPSSSSLENPTSSNNSRSSTTKNTSVTEADSENCSTTTTDNSDSAYTNTNTNFTAASTDNSTAYTSVFSDQFIEENGNVGETECQNIPQVNNKLLPEGLNDNSTQTATTTNLNVISNIQLSQSTLNLIFNQVMQDARKSSHTDINISAVSSRDVPTAEPHVIQVKQVPSFYLKTEEDKVVNADHHRILKCMVSTARTDLYGKSSEVQGTVVPRYSAVPRTTSMEVNTSSADSTDKEDNISLVDSLEGSCSPYTDMNLNSRFDDKPVRGDISPLLPDNSIKSNKYEKASVFFIPIETNSNTEVKPVADHLPDKVRERLSNRQIRRQQKCRETKDSAKSDSNYVSASDNGHQMNLDNSKQRLLNSLPDINSNKCKKKTKPLLPNIESMKKTKCKTSPKSEGLEKPKERSKQNKKKIGKPQSDQHEKPPHWISKTQHTVLEQLSPLYITKRDYAYSVVPNRIYHKTEFTNSNKHIEILEIVDCIEPLSHRESSRRHPKTKHSKIPVLVQSKLPSISKSVKNEKPRFLDFEQGQEDDPKIDQLIANILIDALNKNEPQSSPEDKASDHKVEKRPPVTPPAPLRQSNKYQQIFEAIPEERASLKSSSEDASDPTKRTEKEERKQGASGENESSVPKGWVTFYTVPKGEDSTSEEGRTHKLVADRTDCKENLKCDYNQHLNYTMASPDDTKAQNVEQKLNRQIHVVPSVIRDSFDTWSSSDQEKHTKILYPLPSIYKNQPQKKSRARNSHSFPSNKSTSGEWTVTVSGVTSGRDFAPDLEMRLTFPHNKKSLPDDSAAKKNVRKKGAPETNKHSGQLPHLKQRGAKTTRLCESGHFGSNIRDFSIVEPRQTRTSTRRLLLNRPRGHLSPGDYLEIDTDNRYCPKHSSYSHMAEILRRIPELLKVTGNAISPERKPRAATMSEKDLTKHVYRNS